ncbi:MAG: phosphoribosylamine--glycine ligase, partial [Chloroflexi bacterium]|nr:phosphoribosylamine--glycine ligase [Chloroflexota bacterium]
MRVLIVGGGGREHALAWGVSRSPDCDALFCAPGNAGTALLLRETGLGGNLPVDAEDVPGVVAAARAQAIDFVVVGPEAPLPAGMADALCAAGVLAFGPSRAAAEIESSKWFAKRTMREAGVPHAAGESFADPGAAHTFIDDTFPPSGPVPVIKADGLAAGKGVIVPASKAEAHPPVHDLQRRPFGAAT